MLDQYLDYYLAELEADAEIDLRIHMQENYSKRALRYFNITEISNNSSLI
ncbi:MAG: hypothetical protein ABIE22_00410 [archaeon]